MNEQQVADLCSEQLDRLLAGGPVVDSPDIDDLPELLTLGQQLSQVCFQPTPALQAEFRGQLAMWFGSNKRDVQGIGNVLQRLPRHFIWAELGILGGATGVALAIGFVIVIQLILSPATAVSMRPIHLTIVAILLGLGSSWLLGRLIDHVMPSLFSNSVEQGLQVVLVFSIFTSLLQAFLFTHGW